MAFYCFPNQSQPMLVKLGKSIASEAQIAAKGEAIYGAGVQKALNEADRLASSYGGKAANWAPTEMTSSRHTGLEMER